MINEFVKQIGSLIKDKYFEHFYLIAYVRKALEGKVQFYDAYVIEKDKTHWIIGFRVAGYYYIYGQNWDKELLQDLAERINFNILQTGYHFAGTNELIQDLFKLKPIKRKLFKERIYYTLSQKSKIKENHEYSIEPANKNDLAELTTMVCEYFEDEYKGSNNKDYKAMLPEVESLIIKGRVWTLKHNNDLKSFCSIIDTEARTPIIGSLFTKRTERGKGYGKALFTGVHNFLVRRHGKVWAMTDKSRPEPNALCVQLGYEPIYETRDVIIEKEYRNN